MLTFEKSHHNHEILLWLPHSRKPHLLALNHLPELFWQMAVFLEVAYWWKWNFFKPQIGSEFLDMLILLNKKIWWHILFSLIYFIMQFFLFTIHNMKFSYLYKVEKLIFLFGFLLKQLCFTQQINENGWNWYLTNYFSSFWSQYE